MSAAGTVPRLRPVFGVAQAGRVYVNGPEHEPIVLPLVPEPDIDPEVRAEMAEIFADPAFWDWFVTQPEPD